MKSSFISVDSFNNKNQKNEVTDAVEERQEPENNQPEYKEADVREIPTETSNSDSIIESKEEVKKTTNKKSKKKTSKKK